jgi:hypothetical protein
MTRHANAQDGRDQDSSHRYPAPAVMLRIVVVSAPRGGGGVNLVLPECLMAL